MKGKLLGTTKGKILFIAVCSLLVVSLGATTVFAAAQGAKMVKDGKIHAAAVRVKEGLPAGQQYIDGEESAAENIADNCGTPDAPVRTRDTEVAAGAKRVKEGLPAGQQKGN